MSLSSPTIEVYWLRLFLFSLSLYPSSRILFSIFCVLSSIYFYCTDINNLFSKMFLRINKSYIIFPWSENVFFVVPVCRYVRSSLLTSHILSNLMLLHTREAEVDVSVIVCTTHSLSARLPSKKYQRTWKYFFRGIVILRKQSFTKIVILRFLNWSGVKNAINNKRKREVTFTFLKKKMTVNWQ